MSNRYTIVESVGSATQSVMSFEGLEKHHPSSGQEADRDYETRGDSLRGNPQPIHQRTKKYN